MFGLLGLIGGSGCETLNKWDGGHAPIGIGEVGLLSPQFWGPGYYVREICENIGSNLCNLVHFEVKK